MGASDDEIRKFLASGANSPEEINASFASLNSPATPSTAASTLIPAPTIVSRIPEQRLPAQATTENRTWTKRIPKSNQVTMVVSLALVFGLDLFILITNPGLFAFWAIMLAVLGVFAVFYYLENYVYAKKFANSNSKIDYWILSLVGLRNLVVVLNFIPLIQILGMAAGAFAAVPYLIIYATLMYYRSNKA